MNFSDRVFSSDIYPGVILSISKETLRVLEEGSIDEAANKSVVFPEADYNQLINVREKESVVFLYILDAPDDACLKGTYYFPTPAVQDLDENVDGLVTRCFLAKSETLPALTETELRTTLSELFFNSYQFYSDLDEQQVNHILKAMRSKRNCQNIPDFPKEIYQPYSESTQYTNWQPSNYPSPSEIQRTIPLEKRGISPYDKLECKNISVGVQVSLISHAHSTEDAIKEKDLRIKELEAKVKKMESELEEMREEVKRVTLEFFDGMLRTEYPENTPTNQSSRPATFQPPVNQGTQNTQIDPPVVQTPGFVRENPAPVQQFGNAPFQTSRNQLPNLTKPDTGTSQGRGFLKRTPSPNPSSTDPARWTAIASRNAGIVGREAATRSPSPKQPSASPPPGMHSRNTPWYPVEARPPSPFTNPTDKGRLSPIQPNQMARVPGESSMNVGVQRTTFGYRQSDSPIAMPSSRGCAQECVALIGGLGPRGPVNGIEIFHSESNTWTPYLEFPSGMTFLCGASEVIDHNLFLIGGQVNKEVVQTVRRLNLQSHIWDEISETKVPRKGVCSVKLRELIYLLGEKGRYSNAVETLDPHCNRWVRLPPMQFERARHDAASSPGRHCIYVFGGSAVDNVEPLIERFDPRNGTWTNVAKMNRFRPAASGVIMDDELYVIGGAFECTRNAKANTLVEIFDLRMNRWRLGPQLNEHRWDAKAVAFQRSLYVIGGRNEDDIYRGVERLDEGSNLWVGGIPAGNLHVTRSFHDTAILPPYL